MALHYFDTSGLAKRYVPERGSSWVRSVIVSEPVAISDITTTELASLLGRRTREGQLTAGESDTIFALFLKHRRSYEVVAVDDDAIYDAARLLLGRLATPLRALDALQLVSAERAFRSATDHGVAVGAFVSANHRLLQAAAALGLRAENPEDHA